MEILTIFGDIHANLPALESTLADMDAHDLPNRYCLGDLVGYGTSPNEVIDLVRRQGYPTLMGNYDLGVGNNSDDCGCAYKTENDRQLGNRSIAWSNQYTSPESKEFLRGLPEHIRLQLGRLTVMLVHGSPRKVNEYLYEDRPDSSLERLLDMTKADVMVCGHTHKPYHRILPSGRQVVNAGSVGKPKDGDPRAGYVLLKSNGPGLEVEFRRVAYDVELAAKAIEATAMPDEFAQMLRDGKG